MKQLSLTLLLFTFSVVLAFAFGPALDKREESGILFFGDWGKGNQAQRDVAKGMKSFCDHNLCELGLTVGDNFYPDGVRSVDDKQWKTKFEDIYHPLKLIFRPTLGNHDYGGNIQAQIEYSKKMKNWWMPDRYYAFQHENIDFFAIDTENFDPEQRKWLEKAIEASQAKWKVVYGHHPIYSGGQHGDTKYLIRDLLPIIQGKISFYLCGHDHDLQVILKDNMRYVVSGTAAEIRSVKKGEHAVFAESRLGFSHLLFGENSALLRMLDKDGNMIFEQSFSADDISQQQ